jgi:peroxiredoxin
MAAPPVAGNGKVQVGERYVDFTAPKLGGGEITLSSLVGPHVVLLQFWGIRCAPCLAEFGFLSDLQRRYGGQGLQILGVNTDRVEADRLTEALAARQLDPPYPIVLDSDFSLSKRYTPWLIPVSVVISRSGIVEAVHTGYKPELDSVIEAEVVRLLGR